MTTSDQQHITRLLQAVRANIVLMCGVLLFYALLVGASITVYGDRRVPVDVVFVFDLSQSMGEKLQGLLQVSSHFAEQLGKSGADYRIGMVCFGLTEEREPIRAIFPPQQDVPAFQAFLRQQRAQWGGHEAHFAAMRTVEEIAYRPGARRILILITDEPPGGDEALKDVAILGGAKWRAVIDALRAGQFQAFAVSPDIAPYRDLTERTGGMLYPISRSTDFTAMLLDIAVKINVNLTR